MLQYEALMRDYRSPQGDFRHCCIVCGREEQDRTRNQCTRCGGATDAIYDMRSVVLSMEGNPVHRYFSLLPMRDKENALWLGEGDTPCLHLERLSRQIGSVKLFVKNEGSNPTRTTKDRIASVGLSRFAELGIKDFVLASTGNSSTAYARAVQLVNGFDLHIFSGRRFLSQLDYADHPNIHIYVVSEDYASATRAAQRFAAERDVFFEGGFFNLARREGLKLAYLEAFDEMPTPPQYVFQAISSGMGLLGAYKGALEYRLLGKLPSLPRFIGVQQASCFPMAVAFSDGAEQIRSGDIVHNPTGIAEAILLGDPSQSYPYVNFVCRSSGGQILAVTEAEIRYARTLLADMEGLEVCFSSATAMAGFIAMSWMARSQQAHRCW